MKNLFQKVAIGYLVLLSIWVSTPFVWHLLYNEDQLNLLSWHGYESVIDMYGPIPYIVAVFYLASSVGLIFFKKWARNFMLILTILSIIPLWGYSVSPPVEGSIGYAATLMQGMLLTLAYLTSVSSEFK